MSEIIPQPFEILFHKGRDLADICAADIMRDQIFSVPSRTTIRETAHLLNRHRIFGAPVTEDNGKMIGVVSVCDIIRHCSKKGADTNSGPDGFYNANHMDELHKQFQSSPNPYLDKPVTRIMTQEVHTADSKTGIWDLTHRMADLRIHRIFITVDEQVVGLVTSTDIIQALDQFLYLRSHWKNTRSGRSFALAISDLIKERGESKTDHIPA